MTEKPRRDPRRPFGRWLVVLAASLALIAVAVPTVAVPTGHSGTSMPARIAAGIGKSISHGAGAPGPTANARPPCFSTSCTLPRFAAAPTHAFARPLPRTAHLGSSATNWLVANWSGEGMIAQNPSNPNNLVAGGLYQYLSSYNSTGYYGTGVSGAFTSWDGGRTWVDQTLPMNPQWTNSTSAVCNQLHLADTAIGFGPNNTVYYVDLSDNIGNQVCSAPTASIALYVTISTDGGNTWGIPIGLAGTVAGGFMDKPWIAVDQSTGEVYVAYNDDVNNTISLRNSTNSGRTWSPPIVLGTGNSSGLGVELVVDPWGGVDATWYSGGPMFCRSSDHGAHFGAPKLLAVAVAAASPTPDSFRAFTLPGLGIDGFPGNAYTGRIFSIWQNGSGGAAGSPIISMVYSSDNGTSWTQPRTVNSNFTLEGYQPDLAVGPDGTVYAEWYGENFSDGHYRLYAAESHNGGATFDAQFAVSNNDSLPQYRSGGSAGWWIGDYTHVIADRLGARPLWTDARSPLSWLCSPCLWGVDYNISFYSAEVTNASLTANVPATITVNGTIPFPGNLTAGRIPVAVDALVGDTINLTAPARVSVNGSIWFFDVWFGSSVSANLTLTTSVLGADRWNACYVPTLGERCHAPGAPGSLEVNVYPASSRVSVNHAQIQTIGGQASVPELPGAYKVQAWAVGHWPAARVANVTPGNVTYANLTLAAVPGTFAGNLSPMGAAIRLNSTPITVAPNGTFSAAILPGNYTVRATFLGYVPYVNTSVGIRFNHTTFLPIVLAPIPGWINGTVLPANATVDVNGVPVAVSANTFSVRESLGTYWVNASAPGFYPSRSGPLTMGPFGRLTTNVSLTLIVGTLAGIIVPESATVLVNGQAVNLTNGTFSLEVPPATYSINASASTFLPSHTTAIVRPASSTVASLTLQLSPGWIAATITPFNASVTLDGLPVTLSGSGTFNVSAGAGPHSLVASVPGFSEVDRTVLVKPGVTSHPAVVLSQLTSSGIPAAWTAFGAVVVVAVVAVVLGFWAWRRRRRKGS